MRPGMICRAPSVGAGIALARRPTMELMNVLSAFGLAASAGLNAYIPLLVIAAATRLGYLHLAEPWDILASNFSIVVLTVLLVVEVVADKVPVVDHFNDVIATFIRPVAGAILFAGTTGAATNINPYFALLMGVLIAGATHSAK